MLTNVNVPAQNVRGDVSGDAYFASKASQGAAVIRKRIRQEFQRNLMIELKVFGLINFTHANPAEQRYDAIAAVENCSRLKVSLGLKRGLCRTWRSASMRTLWCGLIERWIGDRHKCAAGRTTNSAAG